MTINGKTLYQFMFLFCFTFFIIEFIYKFSVETNEPKFFLAFLEATLLTLIPIFFCVIVVAIISFSTKKVVDKYKTNVVDFYQQVSYVGNRNEMDFYVVFINNENKKQHLRVERTLISVMKSQSLRKWIGLKIKHS